jgi:ribose-phosphate pyrophosphokinase
MGKIISIIMLTVALCVNIQASNPIMVFTGNANSELAQKVADYLDVPLGSAVIDRFNDGEIQIHVKESVRGKDIFIIQPTCQSDKQSVNDNLMELFLLVRTMKRASASSITAIIPYYGYARQDRKTTSRVPISAADISLLLETAGIDRVVTVDLHCGQIQGFFRNVPVDNLYASPVFVSYISSKKLNNIVIVSPDAGGVERAKKFSDSLHKKGISTEMALISKERAKAGVVASMGLIGNVKGANAIIIDDLCDTGGTLVKAAQLLKDQGASKVFAIITHPVFSGNALEKIQNSVLEEVIISDTIPIRGNAPANVRLISVAPLIGEAIQRINQGKSISVLFE